MTDEHELAAISRDLLARLPEHRAPEHLRVRIVDTLEGDRASRRRGRRRTAVGVAAGIACALGLALVAGDRAREPSVSDTIADSQVLEARLARFGPLRPALDPLASAHVLRHEARLLAIDAELSAAYASGAEPERLASLWASRVDTLGQLLASLELAEQAAAGAG